MTINFENQRFPDNEQPDLADIAEVLDAKYGAEDDVIPEQAFDITRETLWALEGVGKKPEDSEYYAQYRDPRTGKTIDGEVFANLDRKFEESELAAYRKTPFTPDGLPEQAESDPNQAAEKEEPVEVQSGRPERQQKPNYTIHDSQGTDLKRIQQRLNKVRARKAAAKSDQESSEEPAKAPDVKAEEDKVYLEPTEIVTSEMGPRPHGHRESPNAYKPATSKFDEILAKQAKVDALVDGDIVSDAAEEAVKSEPEATEPTHESEPSTKPEPEADRAPRPDRRKSARSKTQSESAATEHANPDADRDSNKTTDEIEASKPFDDDENKNADAETGAKSEKPSEEEMMTRYDQELDEYLEEVGLDAADLDNAPSSDGLSDYGRRTISQIPKQFDINETSDSAEAGSEASESDDDNDPSDSMSDEEREFYADLNRMVREKNSTPPTAPEANHDNDEDDEDDEADAEEYAEDAEDAEQPKRSWLQRIKDGAEYATIYAKESVRAYFYDTNPDTGEQTVNRRRTTIAAAAGVVALGVGGYFALKGASIGGTGSGEAAMNADIPQPGGGSAPAEVHSAIFGGHEEHVGGRGSTVWGGIKEHYKDMLTGDSKLDNKKIAEILQRTRELNPGMDLDKVQPGNEYIMADFTAPVKVADVTEIAGQAPAGVPRPTAEQLDSFRILENNATGTGTVSEVVQEYLRDNNINVTSGQFKLLVNQALNYDASIHRSLGEEIRDQYQMPVGYRVYLPPEAEMRRILDELMSTSKTYN